MSKRPSRDRLVEMYHGEEMSQQEIADKVGVAQRTVSTWMSDLEISTRSRTHNLPSGQLHATFNPADHNGYERWRSWDSESRDYDRLYVHRLLAVAEFGFEAVSGMHVHHRNRLRWDNRPENLELVTNSEHRSLHEAEKQVG